MISLGEWIIIGLFLLALLAAVIFLYPTKKQLNKQINKSLEQINQHDNVKLLIKSTVDNSWLLHSSRPADHPDIHLALSHPEMAVQLPDGTIIPGKKIDA